MTDLTQKLESSLSFARELNALKEQLRDMTERKDAVVEACSSVAKERNELRQALKDLASAYVRLLDSARERIIALGGDCDPVEVMERGDPYLAKARAALTNKVPA
jgi:hypothetical protein